MRSANETNPKKLSLLQAVEAGDFERVKELALNGADLNQCNPQSVPPLNLAAKCGHIAIALFLLQRGAVFLDKKHMTDELVPHPNFFLYSPEAQAQNSRLSISFYSYYQEFWLKKNDAVSNINLWHVRAALYEHIEEKTAEDYSEFVNASRFLFDRLELNLEEGQKNPQEEAQFLFNQHATTAMKDTPNGSEAKTILYDLISLYLTFDGLPRGIFEDLSFSLEGIEKSTPAPWVPIYRSIINILWDKEYVDCAWEVLETWSDFEEVLHYPDLRSSLLLFCKVIETIVLQAHPNKEKHDQLVRLQNKLSGSLEFSSAAAVLKWGREIYWQNEALKEEIGLLKKQIKKLEASQETDTKREREEEAEAQDKNPAVEKKTRNDSDDDQAKLSKNIYCSWSHEGTINSEENSQTEYNHFGK